MLADQEQNDEDDSICDEGAAHDEMSQALSGMVGPAEAKRSNASKNELDPSDDWQCLSNYSMCLDYNVPYLSVDALFEMELQVNTHSNLGDQHEHDVWDELGVDVLGELSALVLVSEEVANDGDDGAEGLDRNVPSGSDNLEMSVSPGSCSLGI